MEEKRKRMDVMVDIETMSTDRERGLILSVGAMPFSFDSSRDVEAEDGVFGICMSINIADSLMHGRIIDEGTQKWWERQKNEAQSKIAEGQYSSFRYDEAYSKLYEYFKDIATRFDLIVWSKGVDFDFPMIESSAKEIWTDGTPYKFYRKRDVRTLMDMAEMNGWQNKQKPEDVQHDALDDCREQIKIAKDAMFWISAGRI